MASDADQQHDQENFAEEWHAGKETVLVKLLESQHTVVISLSLD